MPSVGEDWQLQPLYVIDRLFETACSEGVAPKGDWKVEQFFNERLAEKDGWSWVPSLNVIPLHHLRADSLVRFRCMVQDIFDSEFYLGIYEAHNSATGKKVLRTGMYRDVADCRGEPVDMDAAGNVIFDRQTLYCVPIPGEAVWVKDAYRRLSKVHTVTDMVECSGPSRGKRKLDCEDSVKGEGEEAMDSEMTIDVTSDIARRNKSVRDEMSGASSRLSGSLPDLNFPLPEERGPACLVKMYGHRDEFKVNDMLEVYGILSVDPVLAHINDDETLSFPGDSSVDAEDPQETMAHSPPPSLVPRLHCVAVQQLQHSNPLVPSQLTHSGLRAVVDGVISEAAAVRSELLSLLTRCCLGDSLCAEYLLLHLLSSVYTRKDVVAVGKFSVNICGCPAGVWVEQMVNVIKEITAKSFYFPLSLEGLNTVQVVPQKDYVANRLKSGILQLSDGTHLLLDEMAMLPGQLQEQGIRNVKALGDVIQWQKVHYDFKYHTAEFLCNIPVLVLSEGQSLLPTDCRIYLHVSHGVTLPTSPTLLIDSIPADVLERIRLYLGVLRGMEYNLSEEAQKMVQEEFVTMRHADPVHVTADTLHSLLNVSRLLAISVGQDHLTADIWERAKQLVEKHRERLPDRSQSS